MVRKTLVVIIGGDMEADERELWENPAKAMKRQPTNAIYLDSYHELYNLLSPKKLDLLRYLIGEKSSKEKKSVGQIAKELGRKQEAVSRDLHYLGRLKLVDLKKKKQAVLAQTDLESIQIEIMPSKA